MSRHDAQPDDSAEDLRVKLRRARFHEGENYAQRMASDYWRNQLTEDVREVRDRCDNYATDNPGVRMGLDLAAGWLDILLTRHGLADDQGEPVAEWEREFLRDGAAHGSHLPLLCRLRGHGRWVRRAYWPGWVRTTCRRCDRLDIPAPPRP